MLNMINQLFSLLTPSQARRFYILQFLVVVMALTELVSIASIAPFMALVGDITLLEKDNLFSFIYKLSGVTDPIDFLFYTGLTVLLTLDFSTIVSMFTIWRLSLFGAKIGTEIADRLYDYYMQQDWLFHANSSSAYLTKQVSAETTRVTEKIIRPLIQLNAKGVLVLFISVSIFIYDPFIACGGLLVFSSAYLILYRIVRKRLEINGANISRVYTERFQLMNEGFGGIKDVLLLGRRFDFIERFKKSGEVFSYATGTNNAITQVPRYFMELVAFGVMIGLVLLMIKLHDGDLGTILPILAVYALAVFKLLPALQQVYSSITEIKGNAAAFEAIKDELEQSLSTQNTVRREGVLPYLLLNEKICLVDMKFTYPGKLTPSINGLNMTIPVNSTVGLVGASGAGKSTAIDLLLALLTPQQGELRIDDTIITSNNKRSWQNTIGFVPQSIFLSEGTIAENIAFGIPNKDIRIKQINKVLKLANLDKLIAELPDGINTKVGERGVQLSGGQRQRIGIARALYYDASILVFDEATSSLDGITEKVIMEAIHDFSGKKTIIMIAHRLKTVQECDIIYLMEDGKVIDQGTYQELLENNLKFKEMAEHA